MPRKQRIESSEGLYHVINRGNYRQDVFGTEGAKSSFEKTLFESCERFGWQLHAYCLMTNHFHLCLSAPIGNLSEGMRWLQATFATRFNRYRKESGHLFQGRFKSLVVEPGRHLLDLVDYIHLNPLKAGMVDAASPGRYRWSSLHWFPKRKSRPAFIDPAWMDYDEILADSAPGWRRYFRKLQLRGAEDPKEIDRLERRMCRGWCIGEREFKRAVARDLLERDELNDFNRTVWETKLIQLTEFLGLDIKSASKEMFSARWKVAVASRLKSETSVTNAWLSERLKMGSPNGVSYLCGRYRREQEKRCEYARRLRGFRFEH